MRGDVWLRTDDVRAVLMWAVFTRCADGARQACGRLVGQSQGLFCETGLGGQHADDDVK